MLFIFSIKKKWTHRILGTQQKIDRLRIIKPLRSRGGIISIVLLFLWVWLIQHRYEIILTAFRSTNMILYAGEMSSFRKIEFRSKKWAKNPFHCVMQFFVIMRTKPMSIDWHSIFSLIDSICTSISYHYVCFSTCIRAYLCAGRWRYVVGLHHGCYLIRNPFR